MKPDGNPVFKLVVQGQGVRYPTNPVMFSDKFSNVLAQAGESTWYLSVNIWTSTLGI